jgi:uncharacterized membrane protein
MHIYICTCSVRPVLGHTHPAIQCVLGTIFLRVKQPGREADHLTLSFCLYDNISAFMTFIQIEAKRTKKIVSDEMLYMLRSRRASHYTLSLLALNITVSTANEHAKDRSHCSGTLIIVQVI